MPESIIRFKRGRGFTTIYNDVAQDIRLSLATRGLFALMASLPQDWNYSVSGLAVKANTTRYEVRKCLDNLQEVGYLEREQSHDPGGKFSGNVYVLQDEPPTVVPNCRNGENRQLDLPLLVNLTQQKKDLNKGQKEKAPIPPEGADGQEQLFDRFWKAYPRHEGKEPARRAWRRLKPNIQLCHIMSAALERQKTYENWQRDGGRYIPMPATWLNQRRWEDEQPRPAQAAPDPDDGRRGRFL